MLKNIPKNIPPQLLLYLAEMGHGDELIIADGNFPSHSVCGKVVRCDSASVPEMLSSILKLFPLDVYVKTPVALMKVSEGDDFVPTIWDEYREIINENFEKFTDFEMVERFAFYERGKKAYAVVHTGETELYANIILKKGVCNG